jgi:hypothetical protein
MTEFLSRPTSPSTTSRQAEARRAKADRPVAQGLYAEIILKFFDLYFHPIGYWLLNYR